jgi:hypothetical protein
MVTLDELAQAALAGEALRLRSLSQDWLRENPDMKFVRAPASLDRNVRAFAAAFVEMFADRLGHSPPPWAAEVPGTSEPLFLLKEARTMRRLRVLCLEHSPLPLRRRKLYAPPDYLSFA